MLSSSGIHVHCPLHIATIEGKDITKEQLITKIWGYEFIGDDCKVNSHVGKLQNKWEDKSKSVIIIVRASCKLEDKYEKGNCIKTIYVNNSVVYVDLGNHFCWTNNIL